MKMMKSVILTVAVAAVLFILPVYGFSTDDSSAYRAGFDPIPLTTAADMTPAANNPWMMSGEAEALLLSCMDYRLIDHVGEFMRQDLKLTDEYDYVVLAGASLGVNNTKYPEWGATFWNHVGLAIQLHNIKKVIIIDHRNCGAYRLLLAKDYPAGATAAQLAEETLVHKEQLDKLANAIHAKYPDLGVETYLMALNGKADHIGEIKAKEKAAAAGDKH